MAKSKLSQKDQNRARLREIVTKMRVSPDGAAMYARKYCGIKLTRFQVNALRLCWDPAVRKVAIASGHGMGKGFLAGVLLNAWCTLFKNDGVLAVVTAPTARQAKGAPWSEMREVQKLMSRRIKQIVTGTKQRIVVSQAPKEREWKIDGKTVAQHFTADPTKPTSFQGFHAKRLMVIIDESAGVDPRIIEAASTLVTSENAKFILLGNPTGPGVFERAFDEGSGYSTVSASCFEHPNVLAGRELIPGAVTRQWISDRWDEHGDGTPIVWPNGPVKAMKDWRKWSEYKRLTDWDDPWWQGHVLSIFPKGGVDTLIPREWVKKALDLDFGATGSHALGVDVARYGKDNTTLCVSAAKDVLHMESHPKTSGPKAVKLTRDVAKSYNVNPINVYIDATGIGGMGVVDWLKEAGIKSKLTSKETDFWQYCHGVEFGSAATNPERFTNRKSEILWMLRARFQHATLGLKRLPRRMKELLLNQLPNIKYRLTPKGQYAIESKDEYRKIHGKSPDESEALALSICRGIEAADEAIEALKEKPLKDLSADEMAELLESLGLSSSVSVKAAPPRERLKKWLTEDADQEDDYEALLDLAETDPADTLKDDD